MSKMEWNSDLVREASEDENACRVAIDCPADIQEEIAGEIVDGGKDECSDFVASNGVHYRWQTDLID